MGGKIGLGEKPAKNLKSGVFFGKKRRVWAPPKPPHAHVWSGPPKPPMCMYEYDSDNFSQLKILQQYLGVLHPHQKVPSIY